MFNVLKGGGDNKIARMLQKKFGQMPDVLVSGDHADMFVPRANITESGKAVLWLNDTITELEKNEQFRGSDLVESLKGVYVVLRDCALLAQYELGFREAHVEPKYKGLDLMIRFRVNSKNKEQFTMEIGSALPRDKAPEKPLEDDDE